MSTFSYEGRFARNTPPPRARVSLPHARYEFAVAYPDPDSLPLRELTAALAKALQEEGRSLALYPPIQGHTATRRLIAEKLKRERGMDVSPEQIVLGTGSAQVIGHVIELFTDPGDILLTEEFFYLGTLRAMRRFGATVLGIPCDDKGMRPDALEATLARLGREGKRAKLIYIIPTFQNPLGTYMSASRRQDILDVARRHGVPILEDDCYADLWFEEEPAPAIHALDGNSGQVMYVSSFSKIVAPGVRIGWLVAPLDVVEKLLAVKLDSGTNTFAAMAVHRYLAEHMEEHVRDVRHILQAKRDAMLAALGEHFGPRATWSHPKGGMYIWVRLPQGCDVTRVQETAMKEGVSYFSGVPFSPEGRGKDCIRLCFGYATTKDIAEGIALLARIFEREGVFSPHQ